MTKSPRKNVPEVGIELGAACMPSELASDRATAPGFTHYKIKILTVVVYFYRFPVYSLNICLHWVFTTFNNLSKKAHLKLLPFVVCLQHFVKHINPKLQPYHLNVSFLPYRCIKAVVIISYQRKFSSFLYTLLKYYQCKYYK